MASSTNMSRLHLPTRVTFPPPNGDLSSSPRPSMEPTVYDPWSTGGDLTDFDFMNFEITSADLLRFGVAEFVHPGIDFSNHESYATPAASQPAANPTVIPTSDVPEEATTTKGRGRLSSRGGKTKSPVSKPRGITKSPTKGPRVGAPRGGKRKATSQKRQGSDIIDLTQDDDLSAPNTANASPQCPRQASSTIEGESSTTSPAASVLPLPPLPTHDPCEHHENDASDFFLRQQMAVGRTPLDDANDKRNKNARKMRDWRAGNRRQKEITAQAHSNL